MRNFRHYLNERDELNEDATEFDQDDAVNKLIPIFDDYIKKSNSIRRHLNEIKKYPDIRLYDSAKLALNRYFASCVIAKYLKQAKRKGWGISRTMFVMGKEGKANGFDENTLSFINEWINSMLAEIYGDYFYGYARIAKRIPRG